MCTSLRTLGERQPSRQTKGSLSHQMPSHLPHNDEQHLLRSHHVRGHLCVSAQHPHLYVKVVLECRSSWLEIQRCWRCQRLLDFGQTLASALMLHPQ